MARPPSVEARDKALAAAREVVIEVGVEGFTVAAVAARSGVAKTTIYRHWPDPRALMIESLQAVIATMPTPNTGSLEDDLVTFIELALDAVRAPGMREVMRSLMQAAASDPEVNAIHERLMDGYENPARTLLQLAVGRGDLPADLDLDLAVDLVEGPFFRRMLMHDVDVTPAQLRLLVCWIVRGLRGP